MPRGPGALRGPAGVPAAAQVFVDDLEEPVVAVADAHHLVRVLRLRPGETVITADGRGAWRRCLFAGVPAGGGDAAGDPAGGLLRPDGPVQVEPPEAHPVTVAFVPVKGERPEWVVQKLTELGVDRICVLRSARAVVRWDDGRAERSLERLAKVAREAAAQCRRARLPELAGQWTLGQLVEALAPGPLALADPGAPALTGEASFAGKGGPAGPLAVAVGPEGGWDDAERRTPGTVLVGLAPLVLRAETAALAAGTLLCARRDGLLGRR